MTATQWLLFFFIIQLLHGLATWKLYVKAGRKAWEAFIPVYNAVVLMKIINRPWWWTILLFLPIVNLILFPVIWVEIARSFGKNSQNDTIAAVLSLGFYSFYLSYAAKDITYIENRSLKPTTSTGDWISSLLFAIVAATIVHTYFLQPFVIPTSSLEKTLLVGDFLFVSKFHYGAKIPQTTVALPMVHDAIPGTSIKSYASKPQLPYMRLPGLQKIKRNDIVVFNWPVDTLIDINNVNGGVRYKPVDKKSNYVKRCVGIAGDSLEIKDGYVYINGKKNELPDRVKLQFSYLVRPKNKTFDPNYLAKQYGITDEPRYYESERVYLFPAITDDALKRFKNHPNVAEIQPLKAKKGEALPGTFPNHPSFPWNLDNFGPIYIPEEGKTINLTIESLPLYKRLITEYEGNTLKVNGNQILINNKPTTQYTFKQNYYWMMGDNRHNSQDARSWGYVPFDHVVGKPVFVWMSWGKGGNRLKRWFTTVGGSGEPVSYLIPFLILLAGWFGYSKWKKKKSED